MNMNTEQKLKLNEMINSNKDTYIDQTPLIRELKHSHIFRREIATLQGLMKKYPDEPENVAIEAITECSFLCTYYTDIYNKIRKNEIDMTMLFSFIDILEKIEQGKLDQNEASVEVGTILKKIYVDSALKKADKLNATETDATSEAAGTDAKGDETKPVEPSKNISYKEYKMRRNNIEYNVKLKQDGI